MNELLDMTYLRDRIGGLVGRLHRDESGATLTEFVVMLPVFLLVFYGVMELGQFSRKGSEAPVKAYKQTFEEALRYQKDFYAIDWNTHPTTAAGHAGDQLFGTGMISEGSPVHNRSDAVKIAANTTEALAYKGLLENGHMGESYERANAVGTIIDINGCEGVQPGASNDCYQLNDGRLTDDIEDLVGDSQYAKSLLSDAPDVQEFSNVTNGGVFGALNAVFDGFGIRPAMAAGIRYGTVTGRHEEDYTFAGRTVEMNAYFNTLVPPGTHGGNQGQRADAAYATAISRLTMQGQQHYENLLGIDYANDLESEDLTVPDYP